MPHAKKSVKINKTYYWKINLNFNDLVLTYIRDFKLENIKYLLFKVNNSLKMQPIIMV